MPDDRELADTQAVGRLLADQVPGLAAVDELVVSRQSETLDSDDILVSRSPSASCSGWPSAGCPWWSSWPSSPTCCRCPIPTSRTTPPSTPRPSIHHLLGHRRPGTGPAQPADLRSPGLAHRRVRVGGHRAAGGRDPRADLGLQGWPPRRRPQCRGLRPPGLPGHRGRDRHRGLLGLVPVQDHHHPGGGGHPPPVPGGPGLQPVLRQPRLRGRGQDHGGHPPPGSSSARSSPTWCRWRSPSG